MSAEELKKYKPDEAKEFSFFGSSLVRLSSALSGAFIVSEHAMLALITVGIAWFGHELEQYFKLHEPKKQTPDERNEVQ